MSASARPQVVCVVCRFGARFGCVSGFSLSAALGIMQVDGPL